MNMKKLMNIRVRTYNIKGKPTYMCTIDRGGYEKSFNESTYKKLIKRLKEEL